MTGNIWEDFISLNARADMAADHIGPASQYVGQDDGSVQWDKTLLPLDVALARDSAPLPSTADREGYYGPNHFNYWASGLRDYQEIAAWAEQKNFKFESYLDIGCATGRVLRAFNAHSSAKVFGCDINRSHVDWMATNLPPEVVVFQNTSIPTLPLPEASLDLITAFSVFTHVETFDTTWLMEFHRLLKPGGIAWITVHADRTWRELKPDWPLYGPLATHPDYIRDKGSTEIPRPRTVYRWHLDRSYSANVFYSYQYIRSVWGRIFEIEEIRPTLPAFQEVIVLRKRA